MRFMRLAAILVAFTAFTSTPAYADDPQPDTTSELRKSADEAANAGESEAEANSEKEVAEKAAEVIAGGGEVLPKAGSDLSDGIDNMDEAGEAVSVLVKAFNDKNWFLFTGVIMMLLVFGLRVSGLTAKAGIEGGGLLALTIGIGVISSIAVEFTLVEGGFTWAKLGGAAGIGVMNALIASGAWEATKGKLKSMTA